MVTSGLFWLQNLSGSKIGRIKLLHHNILNLVNQTVEWLVDLENFDFGNDEHEAKQIDQISY